MAYTYEDKIAFIKKLYCAARVVSDETGCSWELVLAQAAQETGWGEKILPGTNNIFNIKADPGWKGESRVFNVWEKVNGRKIWVDAPFRVYPNIAAAIRDRVAFLRDNPRYAKAGLFNAGVKGDLKGEAQALKRAGYATDERYAEKLEELFHGRTMRRSIAEAKKQGCGPVLPVIEIFFKDGAKVAIAKAKVHVTHGQRSFDAMTDASGSLAIKITPLATGKLELKVFDDRKKAWIPVDPVTIPRPVKSLTVTLVAPTFTVATSTRVHDKAPAAANKPAATKPTTHPTATHTTKPAATTTPAKSGAAATERYTIKKGDTLAKIAERFKVRYKTIADLNNISSPYIIRPDQVLLIPKHDASPAHTPATHPTTTQSTTTPPPAAKKPADDEPGLVDQGIKGEQTMFADFMTSLHAVYYRDDQDKPKTDVMPVIHAPWMKVAEEEFKAKVKRIAGSGHHQHIREYFTATSFNNHRAAPTDETAWCAAFCNWCLVKSGFQGNDSAWAANFKTWGRPTKDNKPALGAVAVIKFSNGTHHVTFVAGLSKNGARLATLGGNQGDSHGVTHSHIGVGSVVCYRYPSNYPDYPEDYILHDVKSDGAALTAASTH